MKMKENMVKLNDYFFINMVSIKAGAKGKGTSFPVKGMLSLVQ